MSAGTPIRIIAVASSLRKASCNLGMLRCAHQICPTNATIEIYVPDLPLFNQDIEGEDVIDPRVTQWRQMAKGADAFLFALTENNFSVSAALKNCVDWASRGPLGNCFDNKPAAIMGAGGGAGALRAQDHFRSIALCLNLHVMHSPSLRVGIYDGSNCFNLATGDVVDSKLQSRISDVVVGLIQWTDRIKPVK